MPSKNPLMSKILSTLAVMLTSRKIREIFGLTPERPFGAYYNQLLQSVSNRINIANWSAPKNFDNHDRVVVYWYSLDSIPISKLNYRELNTLLRTGTHSHSSNLWLLAMYLYEAVAKLPCRTAPSFRVTKRFDGFEKIYSPGNTFTESAFISSSRNPRSSFPGALYFSVLGHSGRILSPLAEYNEEDEVLFLPDTVFEVLAVEQLNDGSSHIYLEEKS